MSIVSKKINWEVLGKRFILREAVLNKYSFFLFLLILAVGSGLFIVSYRSDIGREAKEALATKQAAEIKQQKESDILKSEGKLNCAKDEYFVVANITANSEELYRGDPDTRCGNIVETYQIASGVHETIQNTETGEWYWGATPTGKWRILEKLPSSGQFGSWFLRLENMDGKKLEGYALHGTDEPDSIGKWASHGCIRHLNSDIEHLASILPVGAVVYIVE